MIMSFDRQLLTIINSFMGRDNKKKRANECWIEMGGFTDIEIWIKSELLHIGRLPIVIFVIFPFLLEPIFLSGLFLALPW